MAENNSSKSFALQREMAVFQTVSDIVERCLQLKVINRDRVTTEEDLRDKLPEEASDLLGFVSGENETFRPFFFRDVDFFNPDILAGCLQLGEMYKKVFEVCPEDKVDLAVDKYHEDEHFLASFSDFPEDEVTGLARMIIRHVLGYAPRLLPWNSGHFGPGAVAERLNHVDRFFAPIPINLASVVDFTEFPFGPSFSDCLPFSRMIAVPKTHTKPRLIAAEPAWNSWFQQALFGMMERRMVKFPWIDITNPDRNGWLALTDGLATIDQSRASDRVSVKLIPHLFPEDWADLLLATRTIGVDCLCGESHLLAKFAGMGSACTFPVETLVFAALALAAMAVYDGIHCEPDDLDAVLRLYEKDFGVFGDDVVVPDSYAKTVAEVYDRYGFLVNEEKSYSFSPFKESCGVYSFDGVDVTPVRRKSLLPRKAGDGEATAACCAFLNALRLRWDTEPGLYNLLAERLGLSALPTVPYQIDDSHPKIGLKRLGNGFGIWDGQWRFNVHWDEYPKCAYASLSGRRRQYDVTDQNAVAVLYLCLSDVGHLHRPTSISERFSPRPDAMRLRFHRR